MITQDKFQSTEQLIEALLRKGDTPTIPERLLLKQTVSGIKARVVCLGSRKRLKRADRTYKGLKQKRKAKITGSMFEKTCDYYREHGKLSEGEDCERITGQIYQRVKGITEKASSDEIYSLYLHRLPCYEVWATENGIPEGKEKKKDDADKPKVKRRNMSKEVYPNYGRKMKQQLIGLQHRKYGMSRKKNIGYFEHTGDIVFTLERGEVGKKTK